MADVEILHPVLARSLDKDMTNSGTDVPFDEFEPCISDSRGFSDSTPSQRQLCPSKTGNSWKHDTKDGGGKNVLARNGIGSSQSRYGLEPMSLIFGTNDDSEIGFRKNKHKVMSATEPRRPSLSIKKIGDYDLIKTIGSGSTGKVKLAIHRKTREKMAVKIVPRKQLDLTKKPTRETTEARERRILREAAILNLIDHESIVKLTDFLITSEYFCLFFEYVEGVQLLDYIIMNGRLKERRACDIFRQILSAVDYCHHYSIVHRDLKIENIIMEEKNGTIKLLDFGLSNFYSKEECLSTFCGSLYFAAPELLCGRAYTGPEVDVWSLGIILFVLVTGRVPFDDKNLAALHEKIKTCNLQIPEYVSDTCRELLTRMICRDPTQRASMDDVIFHPWVNQGYSVVPAYLPPEQVPLKSIDEKIINFLIRDFNMQFSEEDVRGVLSKALQDWDVAFKHPIISLYFLARDRLYQKNGQMRSAAIGVDSMERSRSLPYIYENDKEASRNGTIKGTKRDNPMLTSIQENRTLVERPRSKSLSQPANSTPCPDDDYFSIKTVYLKGFFSINTTSSRSPMAIRNELQHYLMLHNIHYEDHRSYFVCEHRPSVASVKEEPQLGRVLFEIHIVKLAFLGLHGLQFKRIYGDITHFRNLQTQMISALKL